MLNKILKLTSPVFSFYVSTRTFNMLHGAHIFILDRARGDAEKKPPF